MWFLSGWLLVYTAESIPAFTQSPLLYALGGELLSPPSLFARGGEFFGQDPFVIYP